MARPPRSVLYTLGAAFAASYLLSAHLSPAGTCPVEAGLGVALAAGQVGDQCDVTIGSDKIHAAFADRLAEAAGPVKVWVFFADKGVESGEDYFAALAAAAGELSPRALERRRLRRTLPGLVDERDIPVHKGYVDAVVRTGACVHVQSRWVNAVSAWASGEQVAAIAGLPFVTGLQPVARMGAIEPVSKEGTDDGGGTRDFYGYAQEQLAQINLIAVHGAGYTGQGVVVGILDTGFLRIHEAFNYPGHEVNIVAEWDFVDNDGDTSYEGGDPGDQHMHGTLILGVLGAYKPNEYVGAAYDAAFILAKTEDITGEYPGEEDNYVAGLEFIEMNGGDMATSSLGYIDWYTQGDLDGETAVTTIAVNIATANGVVCCTAAGNGGHDGNPNTSHLIAPADAFQVLACGAVNGYGEISGFSSDGPTADGRVKPEVLARGEGTITVWPYDTTGYVEASGTSLSTPLVAGAVACLIQAHPEWSVDKFRSQFFHTADYYVANGTYDPLYIYGYGVINAYDAMVFSECVGDLDGDGLTGQSDLGILLASWGSGAGGDLDGDGDTDQADLGVLLGDWGCGS